jgi:hypothetical protein
VGELKAKPTPQDDGYEEYMRSGRFTYTPMHDGWLRVPKVKPVRAVRPMGPKHQPNSTYTYLIGVEGSPLVKIGWAKDPEKRAAYLQIGSPLLLSVVWMREGLYENALHQRFAEHRIRGEWFDLTALGDPVEVVKAAVKEIEATVE